MPAFLVLHTVLSSTGGVFLLLLRISCGWLEH